MQALSVGEGFWLRDAFSPLKSLPACPRSGSLRETLLIPRGVAVRVTVPILVRMTTACALRPGFALAFGMGP
jgi:hypothetical protein